MTSFSWVFFTRHVIRENENGAFFLVSSGFSISLRSGRNFIPTGEILLREKRRKFYLQKTSFLVAVSVRKKVAVRKSFFYSNPNLILNRRCCCNDSKGGKTFKIFFLVGYDDVDVCVGIDPSSILMPYVAAVSATDRQTDRRRRLQKEAFNPSCWLCRMRRDDTNYFVARWTRGKTFPSSNAFDRFK